MWQHIARQVSAQPNTQQVNKWLTPQSVNNNRHLCCLLAVLSTGFVAVQYV